MSRDLEPDDFFAIRDQFFLVVDALTTKVARLIVKRQDLIKQTPRPNAEIEELNNQIDAAHNAATDLLSMASRFNAQGLRNILVTTDLDKARSKIQKATADTLRAVQKLDDIRKALEIVSLLITLGGAIAIGITTGVFLPQVPIIISTIDDLTKTV
jgi:hypothetical protein